MNPRKIAMLMLIFFIASSFAHAQWRECGTVVSQAQMEFEKEFQARRLLSQPHQQITYPYHIPLTIHIVRRSDGTGGLTPAQLDTAMRDLNNIFAQADISFFQFREVRYIDNNLYFNIPDSQWRRDQLRRVDVVANTINVYFTNLAALCGQSTFPDDVEQGVLVDNNCTGFAGNPSTFAHEIGHYLNLLHTHETGYGTECPDGSNCSSAGDLLCDTPADPNLKDNVDANCNYTGITTFPLCGDEPYAPQTSNLMSYSNATCRNLITADQISRMHFTLNAYRLELYGKVKYVDAAASSNGSGMPFSAYKFVTSAINALSNGGYVFTKSGTYGEIFTTSKNIVIDKWDTGSGVPAVIGEGAQGVTSRTDGKE